MGVAIFVIDGHDIELYRDAEAAALGIEGYDAKGLDYSGADGTVYEAIVEGPTWGPVSLHPTQENRLAYLVELLRAESRHRGLRLPPRLLDGPEAVWRALLVAQSAAH